MASNSREERRRKIMERGSNRMALITGQIRTLNTSSPPPSSTTSTYNPHEQIESSPPVILSQNDLGQINAAPEGVDDVSGFKLPKHKLSSEASEDNDPDIGKQVEPHLCGFVTSAETTRAPGFNNMNEIQASKVKTSVQKLSIPANCFSSKRINSCIIASERTRAICSLIIASLVLISYIDYPLLGINIVSSESMIASRPLYIVLLTDVTIVLARLVRERGNDSEAEEEMKAPKDDGDNWTGAVKLLERGLVMYQAIRGIFIDCSVYLVIVICSLSLM